MGTFPKVVAFGMWSQISRLRTAREEVGPDYSLQVVSGRNQGKDVQEFKDRLRLHVSPSALVDSD